MTINLPGSVAVDIGVALTALADRAGRSGIKVQFVNAETGEPVESLPDVSPLIAETNTHLTNVETNTGGLQAQLVAANALLTALGLNTDGLEAQLVTVNALLTALGVNTDGIEALLAALQGQLPATLSSGGSLKVSNYTDAGGAVDFTVIGKAGVTDAISLLPGDIHVPTMTTRGELRVSINGSGSPWEGISDSPWTHQSPFEGRLRYV